MARDTTILTTARPVVFSPSADEHYHIGRPLIFAAAVLICIPVILVLNGHPTLPVLAIGGAGSAIVLTWAVSYTTRHTDWLILPLILMEFIIAAAVLGSRESDKYRSLFHYFILFIFCLPVIPKLYRSKILYQGGYFLYVIYFIWCLITVIYSLDPVYSLARLLTAVFGLIAVTACTLEVRNGDDATRVFGHFVLGCSILIGIVAASLV
ncbi:MAG: hypothetical protein ACREQ4_12130, partial [Candidatus Binataceae bacterium]